MKKTLTKALSLFLVVIMLMSTMLMSVSAEGAKTAPQVTVDLIPGGEASNSVTEHGILREVSATTSAVDTTTKQTA